MFDEQPDETLEYQDLTIDKIKWLVGEMLGEHPCTNHYKAGVILLALPITGDDPQAVADFTGYSLVRNIVQPIINRFRDNGIFKDGAVNCEWAFTEDPMLSNVSFILDVMVGTGEMKRKSS